MAALARAGEAVVDAIGSITAWSSLAIVLVMAFNVWFIIWPNQKKALGIVEADDASKAKAATTAMMTSRLNTLLSIPMLYAMISFNNG